MKFLFIAMAAACIFGIHSCDASAMELAKSAATAQAGNIPIGSLLIY